MSTFKATVEQAALIKTLGRLHRVVERRNTIPILGNIMMTVEQDRIEFKATDLDMEVTDSIEAAVAAKGATTVPAHLFSDIARKMPAGAQISLEGSDTGMVVKAGRFRSSLQTLPIADFPSLSREETNVSFALAGTNLHKLISKVQFAISTEETRYYLNGIYLHAAGTPSKATLRAVATDGHRLAQFEIALPEDARGMPGVIVPRKTVAQVAQLFDGADEVQITVSQDKISFAAGTISLLSKVIDGTFPDYGRVIPQNNDKEVAVDRKALQAAVDRVATISSERGRAVKMALSAGKIVLSCSNPDAGTASDELEVEYAGDNLDIGFNSRYMNDMTTNIGGEKVTVKMNDPGSPAIFTGGDEGSLFVLMPMRV